MIKKSFSLLMIMAASYLPLQAQTASTSDQLVAQPSVDRAVPFSIQNHGISKTIEFGADLAWASEGNFRRVVAYSGPSQVDVVRASFQPTYPLINDTDLTQAQLNDLNNRLYIINTFLGPGRNLTLNSDHPSVDQYYVGQPAHWAQLIQTTAQHFIDAGHQVVQVGAFNEPDYSATGQGTISDMYAITSLMKNNAFFSNIRLAGGNTLNCDQAQYWYDYLRPAGVNDGNTHQLAGSFDNFASFITNVRANGHHSTLDEMHNVCEALVGYEYGMQTGIWWGPAELARGEIAKATDGVRIGYAEHRPNWTAAAVYKTLDGKVQAFGGASERQAVTTTYNYISKDKAVYFDGHGPVREFVLEMPGGNGYQVNQPNAERVINITWGEDIQPVVSGQYIIVNRNSGKVLEVAGGSTADGANVQQGSYSGAAYQIWNVAPVDSRVGGDFSYFSITSAQTGKTLDDFNWSLDNGANIAMYGNGYAANQQRYLDYVGDNYFLIRSRHSTHCLDVWGASAADGANVVNWEPNGGLNQQWRLIPVGAPVEFVVPNAPTNLVATSQAASNKLAWTASSSSDVTGYSIFRAETAGGAYNTIARNVTATAFVDNTALAGVQYFYKVKTVDASLNRSVYSSEVSATATGSNAIVQQLNFESNLNDASVNLNKAAIFGSATYSTGKVGSGAITLNGTNNFIQLPADVANSTDITIASWVKPAGGGAWQRIFDFGNSQTENMFLTAGNWAGDLQFTITNGGVSQNIYAPGISSNAWSHVAVTLGTNAITLYVNGIKVGEYLGSHVNPMEFKPVQNYIGRSQWPDPLLNASVDDFRIYNYELSAGEIQNLAGVCSPTAITPVYNVNWTGWVTGTEITINEGDLIVFGPQPVSGGTWSWTGCGTSGASREQTLTLTSSCSATATYTNDCGGVSTVTYQVTVIPSNVAPTVSITSPANGSSNTSGTVVTVSANASDDDGTVSQVEFFANGVSIGVDTSSPYSVNWTIGTGSYALTAVATDNDAAVNTSATVTITGTAPVTVYYQLKNRRTGLFLDGMGRTVNGDNCGQYASTVHVNSQWELVDVGGGYKQLKNRGTGLVLDGMGRTASGSIVGQWENTTGSWNAHWTVAVYSGSYYRVQNRATGLYLDGASKTANGSDANQYSSSTNTKQQWQLIQVSSSGRTADEGLAAEEELEKFEFSLYPNPVSSILSIEISDFIGNEVLSIIDISGKEYMKMKAYDNSMKIDIHQLPRGTYILKMQGENELKSKVFIKQ